MSSISSIDTTLYPELTESIYTPQQQTSGNSDEVVKTASIKQDDESGSVDLSNYYSEVMPGDLLQTVSENVVQSARDLDNAMVSALQNGYTVQDAVNIQLAKSAYEANARVAKTTFELAI